MKHDVKRILRAWTVAAMMVSVWLGLAAPVFGADAARAAPSRWEDVVKAAEKEGEVSVYATNRSAICE